MKPDTHGPKPLYRRVNSRTWGVDHGSGKAARHERNSKSGTTRSMHSGQRHGLDYTPLYNFLQKSVGQDWNDVFSAAKPRVEDEDRLFDIVAPSEAQAQKTVRTGESSYFAGLFIDAGGILRRTAPELENADLYPHCKCCTHSFNGSVLVNKWAEDTQGQGWS